MPRQKVFDPSRAESINAAFRAWYGTFPARSGDRKVAMDALGGLTRSEASDYVTGRRTPSPGVMKQLYLWTQNPVFCMTRAEKDRHRRSYPQNPFPTDDQSLWPDLEFDAAAQPPPEVGELKTAPEPGVPEPAVPPPEEAVGLEPVRALVKEFKRLTAELKKYADLPEGDPKREEARKLLAGPAMALFNSAFKMKLEFPEAFQHILNTMAMAAGKF